MTKRIQVAIAEVFNSQLQAKINGNSTLMIFESHAQIHLLVTISQSFKGSFLKMTCLNRWECKAESGASAVDKPRLKWQVISILIRAIMWKQS